MSNKKKPTQPGDSWVDVHDEELMIKLGIHPPKFQSINFTKSPKEKKALANVRNSCKGKMHWGGVSHRSIPVKAKLIIQLEKNKRFPNTTYSTICYQHQIPEILSKYVATNKKTGLVRSIVSKYSYNGRTYRPNELPFWP